MKILKLTIQIIEIGNKLLKCKITFGSATAVCLYLTETQEIEFKDKSEVEQIINKNLFQFNKVLGSALKGTIRKGQTINCVFIEDFKFLKESDFAKYIRVDRRNMALKIETSPISTPNIYKIFADGSYASETKQSAFGGFIEQPNGNQEIFNKSFKGGSSNLMELLAVSEGLKKLKKIDKIQINSDSRFVIRGLVQWVHFWKHNNWQTAHGRKVKFAKEWQKAYELCENKLVEFKWIKGHSGDEKQGFCDELARDSTH